MGDCSCLPEISLHFGLEQVPENNRSDYDRDQAGNRAWEQGHEAYQEVDNHEDDPNNPDPAPCFETTDADEDIDDTDYKQDDANDCADGPEPDYRQHCTSDKGGDEPHQSEEDPQHTENCYS